MNEYALNRIQMQSMISEANEWFAKATQSNASGEEYREMCEKFQKSFDDAMSAFHAKREQELEEERKRKEEEARQAEAERERKRLAEEEERRAQQKAMVLHWREINQNSYYLSRYISQEDIEFWLRNHNRVYFFSLSLLSSHRIEVGRRPSAPSDLNLALTTSDCQINTEEELNRRAYRIPLNTESKVPRLSLNTPLVSRNLVRLAPTLFYEGDLLEGVPHGEGALIDATLQQVLYQGQWQNGKFNGMGTRYERGALVQSGLFQSGVLVQGRWIQPSGAILVGTFQGQFLKEGRLVLPSGLWIEGKWKDGQPVGKCMVHVANAIKDLEYDFAHPDEITRYVVMVLEDRVYYNNKYLLDQNPIFLFYFNGDVFIGKANGKDEPVNGVYYYLYNNLYQKLSIGSGFRDESLKDVTYCPILPIKQFDLVLQQEQNKWRVCFKNIRVV